MSKGLAPLMIILIIVVLILGASAASYYILKFAGTGNTYNYYTPAPETEDLESELNSTNVDLPDTEFNDLESEAGAL